MGTPEPTNGTDSTQKQSVDFEKRYKDTQSAYTKSQQELKALKAKVEVLEKLTTPKVEIDPETKAKLDDLKFNDPEKWRQEMNRLEREAERKRMETLSEAEKQARIQAEMEHRKQLLEEYNRNNPTMQITEEAIKYDIPPRITSKLEKGEITFEQFINEASKFLATPKVVGDGNSTLGQPDLTNVGGDFKPSNSSVQKDIVQSYKDIVF